MLPRSEVDDSRPVLYKADDAGCRASPPSSAPRSTTSTTSWRSPRAPSTGSSRERARRSRRTASSPSSRRCTTTRTSSRRSSHEVVALLKSRYDNYELVLVDDGSTDATWDVASAILRDEPCIRLLRLSRRFGRDVAISAGLDTVIGDFVVVLLPESDPPELIPQVVEMCRAGAGIAYGIRARRPGRVAAAVAGRPVVLLVLQPGARHRPAAQLDRLPRLQPAERQRDHPHQGPPALPAHVRHLRRVRGEAVHLRAAPAPHARARPRRRRGDRPGHQHDGGQLDAAAARGQHPRPRAGVRLRRARRLRAGRPPVRAGRRRGLGDDRRSSSRPCSRSCSSCWRPSASTWAGCSAR